MGQLVFQATLGGQVNLVGPNTASTFNLDVPAVSSTLATTSGTETLTNKTLTSPTLTSPNITTALTLTGAAGTSGQVLTSAGTGAAPTWTTVGASQWTTSGSNIYYTTGNVGINTSSTPDAFLQVYAAAGKAATFGNNVNNNGNYIVLGGTVSTKNWVLSNNMIVGGEFGIGRTSANGGTTIGTTHDLMIDSNGGVKVLNTLGVGYTTPSTSGAGITFPATQSASTDANTLDDYEEGTWTPALSTTSGSISFSSVSGTYTKIGRLVYVRASLGGTATISSPTGDLKLTSLPFTIGSPEVGAGSTTPYNFTAGAYSINLETIGGTTTAYIFNFANGTRSSAHSYFQAGCFINLSMCYQI